MAPDCGAEWREGGREEGMDAEGEIEAELMRAETPVNPHQPPGRR